MANHESINFEAPTAGREREAYGNYLLRSEWGQFAACAGSDIELFYPEQGDDSKAAKRVCYECPVQQECLDYALISIERHGVWGGTSEKQRRTMRQQMAPRCELCRDLATTTARGTYSHYCARCRISTLQKQRTEYNEAKTNRRSPKYCRSCRILIHQANVDQYCSYICRSADKRRRCNEIIDRWDREDL